jgi:protein-S-isoprenylcysteine O-methyltransferase Ste14
VLVALEILPQAALVVMVLILYFLLSHQLAVVEAAHNHNQGRLVVLAAAAVFLVALALLVHQGRETLVVITAARTLAAEAEAQAQWAALVVQREVTLEGLEA